MPLTPYDIHNKDFKKSFRGYDVDEVNDFLDQIIKDFELLTREKLELEQQVEDLQGELERYMDGDAMYQTSPQLALQTPASAQTRYQQNTDSMHSAALSSMEQSIHKSIRVAQEVAEEVRLNAKKEAELLVQEAEKNADRIINEALQKARTIHSEIVDLKQKATIYRARFRTLVQSHLDILENSDWESLEELEDNLDEQGNQLEEYVGRTPSNETVKEHLNHPSHDFPTNEYNHIGEDEVLDEVAASYMEEEEEPRRELRRSSRKLKKKVMY